MKKHFIFIFSIILLFCANLALACSGGECTGTEARVETHQKLDWGSFEYAYPDEAFDIERGEIKQSIEGMSKKGSTTEAVVSAGQGKEYYEFSLSPSYLTNVWGQSGMYSSLFGSSNGEGSYAGSNESLINSATNLVLGPNSFSAGISEYNTIKTEAYTSGKAQVGSQFVLGQVDMYFGEYASDNQLVQLAGMAASEAYAFGNAGPGNGSYEGSFLGSQNGFSHLSFYEDDFGSHLSAGQLAVGIINACFKDHGNADGGIFGSQQQSHSYFAMKNGENSYQWMRGQVQTGNSVSVGNSFD
jgi:hypothetical protein